MLIDEDFYEQLNKINIKDYYKTTFLNIINRNYEENMITSFLAFLLNPKNNGCGNIIIKQFLNAIKCDYELQENENIEILQEYYLDNGRRIDLLIRLENLWIAIENKINSGEQIEQTNDYFKYIEELREKSSVLDSLYIYLKPNYNKSIPQNKEFKVLLYSDLIKELKSVSEVDFIEKHNYIYLEEFINHSEEYFMSDNKVNISEDIDFYVSNRDKINKILNNYSKENSRLYKVIQANILEELSDEDFELNAQNGYLQIYKKNWKKLRGFHYELLTNFNSILGSNANIIFAIHIEAESKKYIENFMNEGIEHRNLFIKEYNFTTNDNIDKSIEDIINDIKQIHEEFGVKIDNVIGS